jgi:hypothetical protein
VAREALGENGQADVRLAALELLEQMAAAETADAR